MRGKIYGVGVGPGDPELMTVKAVRLVKEADVLVIPGRDRENCVAYQIAEKAVPGLAGKEILPVVFPMTKDETVLSESHEEGARRVAGILDEGKQAVFLTLGDPTVYSTYLYIHKKLVRRGYEAEIVSGVPSFCAAAARLGISLGEKAESIHILPGSYPAKEGLSLSGTKVLMKSGRQIKGVKKELLDRNLSACMIENCGMDRERSFKRTEDIPEDAGYYSLIIVKEQEAGR